jgi:hypothetical protein
MFAYLCESFSIEATIVHHAVGSRLIVSLPRFIGMQCICIAHGPLLFSCFLYTNDSFGLFQIIFVGCVFLSKEKQESSSRLIANKASNSQQSLF